MVWCRRRSTWRGRTPSSAPVAEIWMIAGGDQDCPHPLNINFATPSTPDLHLVRREEKRSNIVLPIQYVDLLLETHF